MNIIYTTIMILSSIPTVSRAFTFHYSTFGILKFHSECSIKILCNR